MAEVWKVALSAVSRDVMHVNETSVHCCFAISTHFLQCCSLNKRQPTITVMGMQEQWDTHPLMFLLVSIARAGLCTPSHSHRCGDVGEDRDISMASPALLIVLHHWWQGGAWNMCLISGVGALPPPIALWLQRIQFLPFLSPKFPQLSCESLSFLQGWTPFFLKQPVIILEKLCQLALHIPWQN